MDDLTKSFSFSDVERPLLLDCSSVPEHSVQNGSALRQQRSVGSGARSFLNPQSISPEYCPPAEDGAGNEGASHPCSPTLLYLLLVCLVVVEGSL